MCLEDQFLLSLINRAGTVEVYEIADSLGISVNALLSIVNRVEANYPHFINIEKGAGNNSSVIFITPGNEEEAKMFLSGGGFTAINEREFKAYSKEGFNLEKLKVQFSGLLKKISLKRWATGLAITVGTSLTVLAGMKILKKKVD